MMASLCLAQQKKQLLPPKESLELLKSYEEYAITLGSGGEKVYAFVDPLCSLSQAYVSLLFRQKARMFSKYTIYLYLLELEGKNSSEHIATILEADEQETMIKVVMVDKGDIMLDAADAEEAVDAIEGLAEEIGVYKWPFIMIKGKVLGE